MADDEKKKRARALASERASQLASLTSGTASGRILGQAVELSQIGRLLKQRKDPTFDDTK